jgi:pre-rRNA-processing protein TSR4
MASYDSDSSGGEDNEYTETNVLLGYASKEPSDDTISQLGGKPVSSEI